MSYTNYLANKILDHIFTDSTYTPPVTLYWALSSTIPALDGSNITEPTTNNYSRVAVTASNMSAATARAKTNSIDLNFTIPSGSWNTCTHAILMDGPTIGANNALIIVDITDRVITSGDTPVILAGGIIHSI